MALSFDHSADKILAPSQPYHHTASAEPTDTKFNLRPDSLATRASLSKITSHRTDRDEPISRHAMLPPNRGRESETFFRRSSVGNFNRDYRNEWLRQQALRSNSHQQHTYDQYDSYSDLSIRARPSHQYDRSADRADQVNYAQFMNKHARTLQPPSSISAAPSLRHSRVLLLQQVRRTFEEQQDSRELGKRAALKFFQRSDLQQQSGLDHFDDNRDSLESKYTPRKPPKYYSRRDQLSEVAHYCQNALENHYDKIEQPWVKNSNRRSLREFADARACSTKFTMDDSTQLASNDSRVLHAHNRCRLSVGACKNLGIPCPVPHHESRRMHNQVWRNLKIDKGESTKQGWTENPDPSKSHSNLNVDQNRAPDKLSI